MKKFKTIMIAIVAAFTVAGMSNISAAAGSIQPTSQQNLTITRTITNAKNAITNTFGYTITPGGSNPSGGVSNFPTTASVIFNGTAPSGTTATSTGVINMTGATFSVNGDYEWTVTETSTTDEDNYPIDSTNTYKIKASVRNANSSNLSTSEGKQVVFFVYKQGSPEQKLDLTENPGSFLFTSATTYKHIEITKTVTGNMADVDKDFTVTVTVGTTGQTYNVTGNNNSSVTTIQGGVATALTINHGGKIIIGAGANGQSTEEIPVNTAYSFTESDYTNYTPSIDGTAGASLTGQSVSATDEDNNHAITNAYSSDTITGTFLKVLPYVVIVAIAVAGVIYLVVRNKKQKEATTEE